MSPLSRPLPAFDTDPMQAIGRLSGGVAHEFNNLLTVMQGHLDAMAEELPPASPAWRRLETLQRVVGEASQITSGLLTFAGRNPSVATLVDVTTALGELAVEVERLAGDTVQVHWHRAAAALPVVLGRPQLRQIVLNLVMNARDAMSAGGALTIATRRVEGEGDAGAPDAGRWVAVSFTDDGRGMDDDVQTHMFEPFFTTKPEGHGTGLGLSICRGLVEQAGGRIVARSAPGRGTTIDLYLPWAGIDAPNDSESASSGAPESATAILVVEDEPDVRDIVSEILRRGGYAVTSASGLADARALLADRSVVVDLLLTDLVLLDGTGLDVAAAAGHDRPGVPVLFMSGYSEAVFSGGRSVEHLIPKPFSARALLARVAALLTACPTALSR